MFNILNIKFTYTQKIVLGFLAIILIGAFILTLPISSRSGEWTPPLDALFTATSATCVTGLVLYDTYTKWSALGQFIILVLIQTGGIGFMTIITMFSVFMKRKIGLHERQLLVHSAGMMKLSGAVRLIKRIMIGAICFELVGAAILATRFCPKMGFWQGIYNAIFHSVSAFCNAGFDLMGKYGQFSSLTSFRSDPVVNITIILLIVTGGIGFIVWDDILKHKLNFRKYELHSKIVLSVTGLLIFIGWISFYMLESNKSLAGLNDIDRVMAALFHSVTPRTAGFNTIDIAGMSEAGSFLTIILMFIGGSSGSTAGGVKTTTLAILAINAVVSSRKIHSLTTFKRRINDETVKKVCAIVTVYLAAIIFSTLILCGVEPFGLREILFEVVSAIGTVGLSMGITPALGTAAKVVIIFLMFVGRVGLTTLVLALARKHLDPPVERVTEKILIG